MKLRIEIRCNTSFQNTFFNSKIVSIPFDQSKVNPIYKKPLFDPFIRSTKIYNFQKSLSLQSNITKSSEVIRKTEEEKKILILYILPSKQD